LIKPNLTDRVRAGRRPGPVWPWLGVATDDVQGPLRVTRVSPEGSAEQAEVHVGDTLLGGGDAVHSQAEFYRNVWGRGAAGSEIALCVLQDDAVHAVKVRSIDRGDDFRQKPMY
jgi:S1-C subfamily serine protease